MSKFLTTHATAYHIEEIILSAREELVLVSPYLQLSKTFFNRLKDADERKTKIYLVYGKNELKKEEESQLNGLKNLTRYFCKELHAKCYFNEETMVITSMNMYEFSEKNNREMGVLITKQGDPEPFNDAVKEVKSILQSSIIDETVAAREKEYTPSVKNRNKTPVSSKPSKSLLDALSTVLTGEKLDAFCIRCGDRLTFDTFHPLCDECYEKWAEYGNPNYTEHFCHSCGKRRKTTKEKPLCSTCFKNINR